MHFRDFGNECVALPGGQMDCGNPYGPAPTTTQTTPGGIVDHVLAIAADPGILLRPAPPPPPQGASLSPFLWGGLAAFGLAIFLGRK